MDSAVRLYDLSQDLGEEHDVAGQHLDLVAKLTATMKAAYTPHENWQMPTSSDSAPGGKKKR